MKLKSILPAVFAGSLFGVSAYADLTFTLTESGGNVILSGSGSLNTTSLLTYGWSANPVTSNTSELNPSISAFYIQGVSGQEYYAPSSTILPPTSIGSGNSVAGTAANGGALGFYGNYAGRSWVMVPWGYTSGASIPTTSSTFSGTLASLGVTAGSYTWNLPNGDKVFLTASSPSPVPEASGSVAGLGLAVAGLYQLRRRRQNTVTE